MTLKELIDAGLIGDSETITGHFTVSPKRPARRSRKGNWFNDQIFEVCEREVRELNYNNGSWDVLLEDEDEEEE